MVIDSVTLASVGLEEANVIVTGAVGGVASCTRNIPVPPASVVVNGAAQHLVDAFRLRIGRSLQPDLENVVLDLLSQRAGQRRQRALHLVQRVAGLGRIREQGGARSCRHAGRQLCERLALDSDQIVDARLVEKGEGLGVIG